MTIQVIVYSTATGRVRRAQDPQLAMPNVISYLAQVPIVTGEARLIYNKQGSGADTLQAWQLAVSNHTGLIPSPLHPVIDAYVRANATTTLTTVTDWYCVIDANNNILQGMICDPAVDKAPANCTLVACAQFADPTWTYNGATFTPPTATVKVG